MRNDVVMGENDNLWLTALDNGYTYELRNEVSNYTLTTEDLFSLSLKDLDSIYADLDIFLSEYGKGKSLKKDNDDDGIAIIRNKMDIVEMVYRFKENKIQVLRDEQVKAEKKQHLMKLIKDKEDESLKELSVDELKDLLRDL